jgi:plasmid stabilization system protein ParE
MLPGVTLPASLAGLLGALRPCFTAPSFRTFCGLAAGLAGQVRRRTVCGMLLGADLARAWPHDRAHYFFARARWQIDELGLAVARLVVLLLVPPAGPLTVAVDDSVFRRSGRKIYGAGWQYDGSSPSQNKLSFGTCFVTCGIVVHLPFCTRPVCLPVLARLVLPGKEARVKNRKKAAPAPGTKVSAAAGLVALLAAAFPGRAIDVVADAAYHGPAIKHLPPAVTWTCRLRANAVLHGLAPPRTPGTRGRPRRKGDRLGTPGQLAAAARWVPATVRIYRRDQDMHLADITCLWYGCLDTRTVRVILARSDAGLLALVTTDLAASAAALITRYAGRWSIEQAFADARNVLGAGQARNRARERTGAFALLIHTLVIVWYARHGHSPARITARRHAQPWYPAKTEPAFEDMLTEFRRVLITARISKGSAAHPTPEQTKAVLAAWHAAAA